MTLWMERAADSLVASFGSGVRKYEAAVRAAITSPSSNGQTEGQITKLKLVRRQMYGRGKIDLLQACLIAQSEPNMQRECVRPNIGRRNTVGGLMGGIALPILHITKAASTKSQTRRDG